MALVRVFSVFYHCNFKKINLKKLFVFDFSIYSAFFFFLFVLFFLLLSLLGHGKEHMASGHVAFSAFFCLVGCVFFCLLGKFSFLRMISDDDCVTVKAYFFFFLRVMPKQIFYLLMFQVQNQTQEACLLRYVS